MGENQEDRARISRTRLTTMGPTWRPARVKNVEVAEKQTEVIKAAISPRNKVIVLFCEAAAFYSHDRPPSFFVSIAYFYPCLHPLSLRRAHEHLCRDVPFLV